MQNTVGETRGNGFEHIVSLRRSTQDEPLSQDKLDAVRLQTFGRPGVLSAANVAEVSPANVYKASLSEAPPRLNPPEAGEGANPFLRFGPPPPEAKREQAKTAEMPAFGGIERVAAREVDPKQAEYKQLVLNAISNFTNESQMTDCKVTHAFPENATQITMTRADFSSKVLERNNDGSVCITEKCAKGHPRSITQMSDEGWQQTQIAYERNAQGRELPWKSSELVSTSDGVSKEIVYKFGAIREVKDAPYKPLTA